MKSTFEACFDISGDDYMINLRQKRSYGRPLCVSYVPSFKFYLFFIYYL